MNRLLFLSQKRRKFRNKVIVEDNDEIILINMLLNNLFNAFLQTKDGQNKQIILYLKELNSLEHNIFQNVSIQQFHRFQRCLNVKHEGFIDQDNILIHELFLDVLNKMLTYSNINLSNEQVNNVQQLLHNINNKHDLIINQYNTINCNIIILQCSLFQIIVQQYNTNDIEEHIQLFEYIYQTLIWLSMYIDYHEQSKLQDVLNCFLDTELLIVQKQYVRKLNYQHIFQYQQIYGTIHEKSDEIVCKYLSYLLTIAQVQNDIDKKTGQSLLKYMLNMCYTQTSYVNISYQILETICMIMIQLKSIYKDFIIDAQTSSVFKKTVQKLIKKSRFYNNNLNPKREEYFIQLCDMNMDALQK